MSFDIFLGCFKNADAAPFPRSLLERAFASFIEKKEQTSWKLVNSLADVWVTDQAEIAGFMVSRPPGDDHPFWPALFDFMRQTGSVLYWPGGDGTVVTDAAVIPNLPVDMIKALGEPIIVTSPAEITDLI